MHPIDVPDQDTYSGDEATQGAFVSVLRRLAKDWVFWLAMGVLVLLALPYVFPVLSEDQQWWLDNVLANLTLYLLAALAVTVGVGRVSSRAERRFWRFIALAMAALLVVYSSWGIAELITTDLAQSTGLELFSQASYLGFYLLIAFALDASRPFFEESHDSELRWVRGAGLGILLAGFLAYFAVAPVLVYTMDPVAWIPILIIYACLDLLLALQALRIRSTSTDRRWRGLLLWIALVFGSFAFGDFLEAADYLEWTDSERWGLFGELQWFVPIAILAIGARVQLTTERDEEEEVLKAPVKTRGGPLVAYAVALPLVHLFLYALDLMDPELRTLREVIVLTALVLVGILAYGYERKVHSQREVSRAELQASRERYSSFVENSVEGIWLLEFDPPISINDPVPVQVANVYRTGRVVESNDSMAAMYGLDDSSAIEGASLRDLFGMVKDSDANAQAVIRFVTSGFRATRETMEYIDAQGRERYSEGSLVGSVEDGFLVRAWATQVDVTQRHEAQKERGRLEHQLRRSQRLETIGTLAGGIAHDFNNILAPILGFAELIESSIEEEDEDTKESLAQIKIAANRAKELVGQILAVGQKTENVRKPVYVAQIAKEAQVLLRQTLPSTVKFETHFPDDCPPAMADPSQVHQIVMNLCTNSGQALLGSSGTIVMEVTHETVEDPPPDWEIKPGEYVVLTVTDDGTGMPAEVQNRAFEPFFKGKEKRSGSGLGLSVTHGIVSGHSGHIELDSQEGNGTKVTIYLPATDAPALPHALQLDTDPAQEAFRISPPASSATHEVDAGEYRVMLVDDEEGVVRTSERMLRRMGYEVESFTDSTKALDALVANPSGFDVLVTDHTMPEVTGPQLAEAARDCPEPIAVVIASGHRFGAEDDEASPFVQLGKPFSMAELKRSVEQAVILARVY